jgi:large subunit ribosomal protein L1
MIKKKDKKQKQVKIKKDFSSFYNKNKNYPIKEAVEIIKKISTTKFDASVEIHLCLGINTKKSDQQIRGAVNLPHGTGKTVRVAAFVSPENEKVVKEAGADLVGGEELIAKIKKSEKTDFQVAVAEPIMMKKLAIIAKILGTRGLMPSPKNDTVTPNPVKAIKELKKGKVSFKNDDTGNLHIVIGKVSFSNSKLIENYQAFLDSVKKLKPNSAKGIFIQSATLASSMSPGIKISIS